MGWKLKIKKMAAAWAALSENQCGMETEDKKNGGRLGRVEREPMWDGNWSDSLSDWLGLG